MKKRILALLPLFLLSSCTKTNDSGETLFDTKWAFGTGMSLTLTGSSKEVFNHVFQIFEDYSNLSDATILASMRILSRLLILLLLIKIPMKEKK